ncbi:hypothetical protein BN1318_390019 [Staphylococcus capitis]|nr:hypothetical protein BN1318_390019 [Staphylococcus capitis]
MLFSKCLLSKHFFYTKIALDIQGLKIFIQFMISSFGKIPAFLKSESYETHNTKNNCYMR